VVHDIEAVLWQRIILDKFVGYGDTQLLQSPVVNRIGLKPDYFISAGAHGGEEEAVPTTHINQPAMGTVSRYPFGLEFSRQGIEVFRMELSRLIQRFDDGRLIGVNHAALAEQTLDTILLPDHPLGGFTAKETLRSHYP